MLTNQTIDPNQTGQPKPFILIRPFVAVWHWLVPPTQAHRDRQSKAARITAWTTVLTLSLLLMGLAVYYARPIHDGYQNWQAERLVKESRQLAEDGQIVNAVFKAQEAYKIAPENINALRLNTEYLTAMKRPEALFFLDNLEKEGGMQLKDRQTRVKALVNLSRGKEAAALLEQLLNEDPSDPISIKLAEEVWSSSQKNGMLLKILKKYAEDHPDDAAHSLRLARLQTESGDSLEISAGIRRAWTVTERDDALGLQAVEFLVSCENLPLDEARRLIERLRIHPKGDGRHQVAALSREVRLNPADKVALTQQAIELARGKSREDLVPMVRWLVEQQQFLQVVALVSEEQAKGYQPLLENYLTALTMLQRFEDLERLVNDPKVERLLNQSVAALYRAHLAYVTKKPVEEIRKALIAARNAADMERRGILSLKIGEYAETRGFGDIAEQAYQSASQNRQTDRQGYMGLMRTTEANGNTEGLLSAAKEAVHRWPDDTVFVERYFYVNLLTGREIETTLQGCLKLHEEHPEDHFRKLMTAMAFWRLKDFNAAYNHLQNLDVGSLSAGQKAMVAAVARDTGVANADQAVRDVVSSIQARAAMLPEERQALARATR